MIIKVIKTLFAGKLKIHYGQWAEDVLVRKLFSRKKKDGVYLDIGAFHPYKHSNTATFWLKGWSGINIDANPNTIKKFNKIRPNDVNICNALVPEETYKSGVREIELLLPNKNDISAIGTCNNELANERNLKEIVKVKANTINNILIENKVTHVDYMNIDVEGFDLQVLQSFDFNIVKPVVISIEDYSENMSDIMDSTISSILFSEGYKLVARAGLTSIYQYQ